jgi:hypothetical protein
MRIFHCCLLVTLSMFLGGVVIAEQAAPAAPGEAAATPPPAPCDLPLSPSTKVPVKGKPSIGGPTAKATIKDIMNSMMVPASTAVWNSVADVTDATGVHESKPETDDQWNNVYLNAVELTEIGNLLMVAGRERCVGGAIPLQYRADFNQKAREIIEAGNVAMIAAKKHDLDGISEAGERIDVACDACHEVYQIAAGDPDNYKKVLGTYKLTPEEKAARDAALAAEKPAVAKAAAAKAPAASLKK